MILLLLGINWSPTIAKVLPILEHGELMDSLALQYDETDCLPGLMAGPADEMVVLPGSSLAATIPVLPTFKPPEPIGTDCSGAPIIPAITLSLTLGKDKIIR